MANKINHSKRYCVLLAIHLIFFWTLSLAPSLCKAQSGEWSFLMGDTLVPGFSSLGTNGGPGGNSFPGSRRLTLCWQLDSKFYFYGGSGSNFSYSSGSQTDLWEYDANTKSWSWLHGSTNESNIGINYGVQGLPAITNTPGSRIGSVTWTRAGKLYLFGGGTGTNSSAAKYNDIWEFDPGIKMWTWISGTGISNATGTWGIRGITATDNYPSGRVLPVGWQIDSALYVFGGYGKDSTGTLGYLSDLWRYDMQTGLWTWISGPSLRNQPNQYGIAGVANAANAPGSRTYSQGAAIGQQLFLFGGVNKNDLWRYDLTSKNWTWLQGDTLVNQPYRYGIKGVYSIDTRPGAKSQAMCFARNNHLFLFGGTTQGSGLCGNDMWEYDPAINQWRFVAGDTVMGALAVYGTTDQYAPGNTPGGTSLASMWTFANECYLYSGSNNSNFLWSFDVTTSQWAFRGGNGTISFAPHYGIKGVFASENQPGHRYAAGSWSHGHSMYIFGGLNSGGQSFNDLWEFDITQKKWRWLCGDTIPNQPGYSITGVPMAAPGSRRNPACFTGKGKLYLAGGYGYWGSITHLIDVWEYDIAGNVWTSLNFGGLPRFGVKDVAAPTNMPYGRTGATGWYLDSNLYLFGGKAEIAGLGFFNTLSDLWKFNIPSKQWTWLGGDTIPNQIGTFDWQVYPPLPPGAPDWPSSRSSAGGFIQGSKLYLFGGFVFYNDYTQQLGDMCAYDLVTRKWSWKKGRLTNRLSGIYGIQGIADTINYPAARNDFAYSQIGDDWYVYGGSLTDVTNTIRGGLSNELWRYSISKNEWTWLGGDVDYDHRPVYAYHAIANNPGSKLYTSMAEVDGALYLFGGLGLCYNGWTGGGHNELWKYMPPMDYYCPGTTAMLLTADTIPGAVYQWQVQRGGTYVNLVNDTIYSGVQTAQLHIQHINDNFYGTQLRCRISAGIQSWYGAEHSIKFAVSWTGAVSDAWENPGNWNCGSVPGANTDVFINKGAARYPVINAAASCHQLILQKGTSVNSLSSALLQIVGQP